MRRLAVLRIEIKSKLRLFLTRFNRRLLAYVCAATGIAAFGWYLLDGVWGPVGLTRYELIRDYKYLWTTLEETYPFLSDLEKNGKDVEAIESRYFYKTLFCPSEKGFYRLCEDVTEELSHAGGLELVTPGRYVLEVNACLSAYSGGYSGYYILKTLGVSDPWFETYAVRKTLVNYEKFGKMGLSEEDEPPVPAMNILRENIAALITVYSLDSAYIERDRALLEEYYKVLSDYENVIFSVADGGGGSNEYWQELIVKPNISGRLYANAYSLYNITEQNAVYMEQIEPDEVYTDLDKVSESFGISGIAGRGFSNLCVTRLGAEGGAEKALSGKLWLLTDENTTNAADSFAYYCKASGFAELVGYRTGGGGLFEIKKTAYTLPRSRLIIRFSGLYTVNAAGESDSEGVAPDILCSGEESPLDACVGVFER